MNPHRSRKHRIEKYGFAFDNPKELERYEYLKLRERAGEIENLTVHPQFDLTINQIKAGTYTADFMYRDLIQAKRIIEDCKPGWTVKKKQTRKGVVVREWTGREVLRTPLWSFKKRVVEACIGQTITEIWS